LSSARPLARRGEDRPEKAVTTALGVLLLAERAALLSGRDDEFVAVVLMGFTGMRWGELVGLEPGFVRQASVRVEWQLYELDSGELHRCPPKDGSYRTIDTPGWLSSMLSEHIALAAPKPCGCHGCPMCSVGWLRRTGRFVSRGLGRLTWLVERVCRRARCPRCLTIRTRCRSRLG
jgi:hypothetical protein